MSKVRQAPVNAHSRTPARVHNEQRIQFLERFSECGSVLQACQDTGVARRTHYDWLVDDPEYKAAFERAKQQAIDALESRVFQRANVESDRLAEFLLKGLRPELYGERMKSEVNVTGSMDLVQRLQSARRRALIDDGSAD
jgi:hypothetical protein